MSRELLNSRFVRLLPMTDEEAGRGGCNLSISYSFADTPFGEVLVASTSKGICYLAFVTVHRDVALQELTHFFPRATFEQRTVGFHKQAIEAFGTMDRRKTDMIPLHLKGTDFQLSVWQELLSIPLGEITSYGKIAQKLNKPKACRAVGTAVGDNPVSVLIPCHRVLRTDGALGGYHWGLQRKVKLLEWENIHI